MFLTCCTQETEKAGGRDCVFHLPDSREHRRPQRLSSWSFQPHLHHIIASKAVFTAQNSRCNLGTWQRQRFSFIIAQWSTGEVSSQPALVDTELCHPDPHARCPPEGSGQSSADLCLQSRRQVQSAPGLGSCRSRPHTVGFRARWVWESLAISAP